MRYAGNRAGYVEREGEGSTGPSRGEHRLTVYRAHASGNFRHKNEDISESVNSFASRAIFQPTLGHDLSRNASVASILFPERISHGREDFFHDIKK